MAEARRRRLLSADHFTVDGTLLEAWASLKSYHPRDEQDPPSGAAGGRNREVDFRGQRRRRETHVSSTDPQAQLYTKGSGQTAKLCSLGHLLTENRHGLVRDVELTEASGYAEREAALAMLDRSASAGATLGADRGYDTRDFVAGLRARGVTPYVAQNESRRRSAVDGRTTRHAGYGHSQRRRKLVEQVYGWVKTVGGGRKLRFVGLERNRCWRELTARGLQPRAHGQAGGRPGVGAVRPPTGPGAIAGDPEAWSGGRPRWWRRLEAASIPQLPPERRFFSTLLAVPRRRRGSALWSPRPSPRQAPRAAARARSAPGISALRRAWRR